MASSQIYAIYDNIAGWDVYFDSDLPAKVLELHNQPEKISSMEGVVRVISHFTTGEDSQFIALGKTLAIDWVIEDTLYVRPTAHLSSLRRSTPQIMNYVVNYLDAIKNNRSPANQCHIAFVAKEIGTGSYPEGADEEWFTVRFTLTIREIIN